MADTIAEPRPLPGRFFCHKCNVEFEEVLQEYKCPYCAGGFVEQLDIDSESLPATSTDESSDIDMSVHEESEDGQEQSLPPYLNDLAFLMSGRGLRGMLGGAENIIRDVVITLAGGISGNNPNENNTNNTQRLNESGIPVTGAATGGINPTLLGTYTWNQLAPMVVVTEGNGDIVFGEGGLDAVVSQLLSQLESSGPPPLPRDRVEALPIVKVTEEQVEARLQCSICWEQFQKDEAVRQLECEHVFHEPCITPWLNLHATCPICRHSLLTEQEANQHTNNINLPNFPTLLLRGHTWPTTSSTTQSTSTTSTTTNTSTSTNSNTSDDKMSQYNMDLDYD